MLDLCKQMSLSGEDMKRMVHSPIYTFHDMLSVLDGQHSDSIFGRNGTCILFIPTGRDGSILQGHWTCLIKHRPSVVEFFDPYGISPPTRIFDKLNAQKPFRNLDMDDIFKAFIRDGAGKMIFNKVKLQRISWR